MRASQAPWLSSRAVAAHGTSPSGAPPQGAKVSRPLAPYARQRWSLAAALIALAPGVVSCSPTCDDAVPCHDALMVALPISEPGGYTLQLEHDQRTARCELRLEASGRIGSHECDSGAIHLGAEDGALWLLLYGTPSDVRLRLEHEGALQLERRLTPSYVDLHDGSQGCVSCLQAEVDLTAS